RARWFAFASQKIKHAVDPSGVLHSSITRCAFARGIEQPGRRHKSNRRKARGFEFITRFRNARESFLVIKIEKFAFVSSVKSRHEFFPDSFARAPRAFMKITV